MKRIFLCVIILMTSAVLASAQLVGILEDDARIVRGTMPNGLAYYLVPNSSVKGYADFAFVQRNGLAMEDSSSLGMTYLMECMALTETHNFPDGAIFSFIDDMGLSRVNGLEIEAGDYHTIYSFNDVPIGKNSSMVDSMLLAMFNMSSALIVDDRSVERGKHFLRNVMASSMTLDRRIEDSLARYYFAGTPLAPAAMGDLLKAVGKYTTADVAAFYKNRCRPDRQAIVIAGDIDAASVESKIRALFQIISRPDTPLPDFPDSVLDAAGGGYFYFQDREADRARVTFDYIADPLDPSLRNTAVPFIYNYVSEVGMDIMKKRLMSALEDAPFYALDVQTGIVPYLNRISYRLSVECAPEDYVDAYVLILNEVERVCQYGISDSEFRKSSEEFIDRLDETYRRRSSLDNKYYRNICVSNFTDGYVMAGIELYKSYIETAENVVDSHTVSAFLSSVFSVDSCRTVVCSSPEPTGGLEYFAVNPGPYVEKYFPRRSSQEYAAGSITERNSFVNKSTGVVSRRLPNGAVVAFRKMDAEPGMVYFTAVARGGVSLSGDSLAVLRKYINDVARISLVGKMNMYGMQRFQDSLGVSLERTVSVGERRLSGSFPVGRMEDFLDIVAMYFEGSEPDYRTFDKFRRMEEGCGPYALNSPEKVFQALRQRDIRSMSGVLTAEEEAGISELDYDAALKFVNALFSNVSEFSFIFVGDFEENDLLRSAYASLSGLPGRRAGLGRSENSSFFIASYDAAEEVRVPMSFPRWLYSCKLTVPSELTVEDRMLSEVAGKVIEREVIRQLSLRGILAEAERRFYRYPEEVMTVEFSFTTAEPVEDVEDIFADILVNLAENRVSDGEVAGVKRNMALKDKLRESRDYKYWEAVLRNRFVDMKDFYTRRSAALDAVTAKQVNEYLYTILEEGSLSTLSVVPE